jgi:hypothetical protein
MIEFMPESSGEVLGVTAHGKLTDADYKQTLIPRFDSLLQQHGNLKVLFYMADDFEGWDLEAAWDDASYGLKHRADFERMAVVGGPDWVDWCIKWAGFLMKGEIKVFPADQLDQAWTWVRG